MQKSWLMFVRHCELWEEQHGKVSVESDFCFRKVFFPLCRQQYKFERGFRVLFGFAMDASSSPSSFRCVDNSANLNVGSEFFSGFALDSSSSPSSFRCAENSTKSRLVPSQFLFFGSPVAVSCNETWQDFFSFHDPYWCVCICKTSRTFHDL